MHRVACALTWEFWRKGWTDLVSMALLGIGVSGLFYAESLWGGATGTPRPRPNPLLHAFLFTLLIPMLNAGSQQAIGGMRRRFTLPVSTRVIVAWPLLNGVVAASGIYLLIALFWNATADAGWPLLKPAVAVALVFLFCQACGWCLQVSESLQMLLGAMLATALAVCPIWLQQVFDPDGVRPFWEQFSKAELALAALGGGGCYLAAVVGLRRARRSQQFSLGDLVDWLLDRIDRFLVPRRGHASAAAAQLWLDWTERGLALPIIAVSASVGCMLCFASGLVDGDSAMVMIRALSVMLAVVAAPIGFFLGHSGNRFEIAEFKATRPLTDTGLADVVLKNVLHSVLRAALLWLAGVSAAIGCLIAVGQGPPNLQVLFAGTRPAPILSWPALLGTVGLYVGVWMLTVWSLLAVSATLALLRRWLVVTLLSCLVLVPLSAQLVATLLVSRETGAWISWAVYSTMSCLLLCSGVAVYAAAWRWRLIGRWRVTSAGAAYLLLSAAGLAWVFNAPLPSPAALIPLVLAGCMLAVLPLALAPLAIWWNRHR